MFNFESTQRQKISETVDVRDRQRYCSSVSLCCDDIIVYSCRCRDSFTMIDSAELDKTLLLSSCSDMLASSAFDGEIRIILQSHSDIEPCGFVG